MCLDMKTATIAMSLMEAASQVKRHIYEKHTESAEQVVEMMATVLETLLSAMTISVCIMEGQG
jgi:hypothetical protein